MTHDRHGVRIHRRPVRAGLVSIACLLGGLPLLTRSTFFGSPPRTPLRVLCVTALDTIHLFRHARRLPPARRALLAAFLDFQACTNAALDGKPLCAATYKALRQRLEGAHLESLATDYLGRIRELEMQRPPLHRDNQHVDDVRGYREAVVRLSLATVVAIALHDGRIDDGVRATYVDSDVAVLFRMAMQCQIIDDVVDYRGDLAAGLPSFLTASASLRQSIDATAAAARSYVRVPPAGRGALPLEVMLTLLTWVTVLVVWMARRVQRDHTLAASDGRAEPVTGSGDGT